MLLLTAGGLYWDLFISLIGMGFFIYGKKRPDVAALVAGLILIVYPYFIKSLVWDIACGVAIVALYIILKRVLRI
jgi:hypothetical protein